MAYVIGCHWVPKWLSLGTIIACQVLYCKFTLNNLFRCLIVMRESEEDKRLVEMLMDHRYWAGLLQELHYTSPYCAQGVTIKTIG